MLNRVVLIGRLVADVELRYTPSGIANATFRLAVNRSFKRDGQPDADFIGCVAWRQLAETCANYLRKGRLCAVEGRIQTRNYENNEAKRLYVTAVIADNVRFLESNRNESSSSSNTSSTNSYKYIVKANGRPQIRKISKLRNIFIIVVI